MDDIDQDGEGESEPALGLKACVVDLIPSPFFTKIGRYLKPLCAPEMSLHSQG